MKRLIGLALAAALVASVALVVAMAASGAFSAGASVEPLAQVSNQGVPFDIPAPLKHRMGLDTYSSISRLSTKSGEHYLRFSTGARDCFGNGLVAGVLPVAVVKCVNGAPYFPSASKPILDLSVVEVNADGSSRYVRVGGVAADGVAAVGVLNAAGEIVQTVPVVGNVYDSANLQPGTVASLVALDANGAVVAGEPR